MMRRDVLSAAIALALLLAAGCGGGGGSSPAARTDNGVLTLTIPPKSAAAISGQRRAQFVSPSTQSVSIVVNTLAAQIVNVTATSPNCTAGAAGITCNIPVEAPPGNDTFTITLYDGLNGSGNVLGTATATATVALGSPFSVNANAIGEPGSVQLTMTPNGPGQALIGARELDADGNAISGTYATPVAIAVSGALGVTLGGNSIASSTATVTATYTFPSAQTATVTATLGSSTATATLPLALQQSFPIPTASSNPFTMGAGPDGNAWFAEDGPIPSSLNPNTVSATNAQIARITTNGTITEFPLPLPTGFTVGPGVGSDGNLWIGQVGAIDRVTTSGTVTEFPAPGATDQPRTPVNGPDNNLWAADRYARAIDKITTAGVFTQYPLSAVQPVGHVWIPTSITNGPDGALWFTIADAAGADQIGRITTGGVITAFAAMPNSGPRFIVTGSDGNLWYSSLGPFSQTGVYGTGAPVSKMTTSGAVTNYTLPFGFSECDQITAGPDGNLWCADFYGTVDRITTSGAIDEFPLAPIGNAGPDGLTFTPDGALWVDDRVQNAIVKMVSAPGWIPIPSSLTVNGTDPTQPAIVGIYESGNSGPFTVTIADSTVAAVAPLSNSSHTYTVVGKTAGTTSLVIVDAHNRAAVVPVTVGTTTGTIQSRARSSRVLF